MNVSQELQEFWNKSSGEMIYNLSGVRDGVTVETRDKSSKALVAYLLDKSEIAENSNVLDFGCGVGRLSRAFNKQGHTVIGVDVSPRMLHYAKFYCKGCGIRFELCDGLSCRPVEDDWADVLISYFVFQHMPTRDMVKQNLEDFARVVKSGGLACIQSRATGSVKDLERVSCKGVRFEMDEFVALTKSFGFRFEDSVEKSSGIYKMQFIKL